MTAYRAPKRDPYTVKLTPEQHSALQLWLTQELQEQINAKATAEVDVEYWHAIYEQARTRARRPWPDAADLTSYLGAEKVDAMHARILRNIFVEPICTVTGWGEAASRAPFNEEFHQWKAEETGFQAFMDRAILLALIEPRALVEITEATETRRTRKTITAKQTTDPLTGGLLFQSDGTPMLEVDEQGAFAEAKEGELGVEQIIDADEPIRSGPTYHAIPYRDSVIFPEHARDEEEVWGYAKRFWRRLNVLQARAQQGIYDPEAIDKLKSSNEREPTPATQRQGIAIASPNHANPEIELYECLMLLDLKSILDSVKVPATAKLAGERWYLVTIHLPTQQLLRLQHDDLNTCRYVTLIPYPRPDRVTEGYSLIGHKLITIIEEHTAWRNMGADKGALAVQAPIKRMVSALWTPEEQPWSPKAVIDVRDMREIEQQQVSDVPASVFTHIQMTESISERVAGINDLASGQVSKNTKTLGEIQLATEQSFVRMDLVLRRIQEGIEKIYSINHEVWKRTLRSRPEGMDAPETMVSNLKGRGQSIDNVLPDKKITAAMLEGAFRFKPHGSVQTADPNRRRQDVVAFLQILPAVLQFFPMLAMQLQSPNGARAMWRMVLQAFNVENQAAFIGSPSQDFQQTLMAQAQSMMAPPGMGMQPPGMPGAPPMMGGPPMPPGGMLQ